MTTVGDTPRPALERFRGYVRPYAGWLGLTLLLVAIVGILEAALPLLLGLVVDLFVQSETPTLQTPFGEIPLRVAPEYGVWILVALIASTILKAVAGYASIASTAYVGHSVVRDLRTDLYRSIVFQSLNFFAHHSTGALISRVSADVEKIQTAASDTLAEFLKQAAILFCLLLLIFSIDWQLSILSLVLVPLVFYPTVWFGRRLRRLSHSIQAEMADMANILFETFSGNRIVKIFTMESAELGKFRAAAGRVFRLGLRQRLTHALSSPLMEILGSFVIVGFIVYAGNEIQTGGMTPGLFVAFIFALIKLYDPLRRMSGINNSFQQAIGASGTLFEIMESEVEPDLGDRELEAFRDSIEFEDVRFAYTQGEATLDGVSFKLLRGEVLALVGSSGVGKTTLANLIPRFYDVNSGTIAIDGVDIRDFRLRSLRDKIAMVTQDVILFNDTIRTNIAYGNPGAGEDAIQSAAKAALVDNFVPVFQAGMTP